MPSQSKAFPTLKGTNLDSRGSSLVEVMAASIILLLTLTGVSNAFLALALQNRSSENVGESINSVQLVLDRLRLQTVELLPNGGTQEICNPDINYACAPFEPALQQMGSVIVTYCPNVSPSYCDSSNPMTRHLQVDVLGNDGVGGTEVVFTAETVFTDLTE